MTSESDDREEIDEPVLEAVPLEAGSSEASSDRGSEAIAADDSATTDSDDAPGATPAEPEAASAVEAPEPPIEAPPAVSQPAPEEPPLPGGPPEDPADMENIDDAEELWGDVEGSGSAQERVSVPRSPGPPGHLPERRVVVIDDDTGEMSPEVGRPGPLPREDESADAAVASIGSRLEDEDDSKKRRWRLFRKGGD
jgi:hypothetical protein